MTRAITLAALLALSACVTPEAGCSVYAMQRPSMPALPNDALGAWVATTDTALTRAC